MMMSDTNDLRTAATFEHHNTLADSELDAVTGGRISTQHPAKVRIPRA